MHHLVRKYSRVDVRVSALPPGCTAGKIPNFSTLSERTDIQCTACLEGLVLNNNHCEKECPAGSLATNKEGTATCQGKVVLLSCTVTSLSFYFSSMFLDVCYM